MLDEKRGVRFEGVKVNFARDLTSDAKPPFSPDVKLQRLNFDLTCQHHSASFTALLHTRTHDIVFAITHERQREQC